MKKDKNLVPKTLKWRKYVKITIWVLVIFWTLGSFRGFSLAAKLNAQPQVQAVKQEVKKENFATSIGAQNFAQNFLKEYLTWNKDNYQERVDRLQPYLRKGTDEQAGLRYDSLSGNSAAGPIQLWKVAETGKNKAILTFRASHTVKTMTESKGPKGKIVKKEVASKPLEKWIQVPIITDNKSFLVNGIPTFTSKPAAADIQPIEAQKELTEAHPNAAAEIKNFLNTFFKQYSTGTKAELQYLTTDPSLQPLDKSIVFREIENLVIIEKNNNSYTLEAQAVFIDSSSKAQVIQKYILEVSEQNGRWQVTKFN